MNGNSNILFNKYLHRYMFRETWLNIHLNEEYLVFYLIAN